MRVALGCGCVYEEWTLGPDDYPDARREDDPLVESPKYRLRESERRCRHQHQESERNGSPYKRIVGWDEGSRTVRDFEADPIEPPADWTDQPELWAAVRHATGGQTAHWVVELDCGHHSGAASSVTFRPQDGPQRATAKRLAEMKAEWSEYRTENPVAGDDPAEAHEQRMLDEGWPIPRTETTCYWCGGGTSGITAYQRIGFLEPKQVVPRRSERQLLQEKLARLEAEERRLRQKLSDIDGDS